MLVVKPYIRLAKFEVSLELEVAAVIVFLTDALLCH